MPDDALDATDDLPNDAADRDEIARELDEEYPPPRNLSRPAALVAAGLSVVAGILCVFAPFRAVYTLRASGISASFDGWGRYDLATGSQHGPRYGIALTVAAVVLVIAGASRLRDLRPVALEDAEQDVDRGAGDTAVDEPSAAAPDPATGSAGGSAPNAPADDRLAAGVGIAGSALLLGVLGAIALNIESTVSNANSIAASTGGTATAVDVGGMLWILVGAWVVSVVAVYLPWFEARRRS